MPTPGITVAVVGADAITRYGLHTILTAAGDLVVVAEGPTGTGVRLARAHRPAVLLLDLDSDDAVDDVCATGPRVGVLTSHEDRAAVGRALAAGVLGVLAKNTPPEELVAAVRMLASGHAVFAPWVWRELAGRTPDPVRVGATRGLSVRELEVLALIGRGASNAEIAAALALGPATVKTHVSRVMVKLGCANRVQAALMARSVLPRSTSDRSG